MPSDPLAASDRAAERAAMVERQLGLGGRLLAPVGTDEGQRPVLTRRLSETEWAGEALAAVRFVPLLGAAGWPGPGPGSGAAGDGG